MQTAGCLNAIDTRHAQVHQDDFRVMLGGQRDGFLAVGRGRHELDLVEQPQQRRQALAHQALVIGEQDPDRAHAAGAGAGVNWLTGSQSSTRNPSAVGSAVSLPPSSSARSRIPVSP